MKYYLIIAAFPLWFFFTSKPLYFYIKLLDFVYLKVFCTVGQQLDLLHTKLT